ncbi:hypothetical protein A9Q98_08945, partial [Thalassotalea sp. 42_200_T64]
DSTNLFTAASLKANEYLLMLIVTIPCEIIEATTILTQGEVCNMEVFIHGRQGAFRVGFNSGIN